MVDTWITATGAKLLRIEDKIGTEEQSALQTADFDGLHLVGNASDFEGLGPYAEKIKWLHAPSVPSSSGIEKLTYIERIVYISHIPTPPIDYRKLPNLKSLSCNCASLISIKSINHPIVEILDLEGLKAKDLNFLSDAKRLRCLRMVGSPLKTLDGLQNHVNLIELRLIKMRSLEDISYLRANHHLEALELTGAANITDVSAIYGLSNLRWLFIDSKKAKQRDMNWIDAMPNLECASIMIETEKIDWDVFARHPRLYDVAFYSHHGFTSVSDDEILEMLSAHGRKVKSFKRYPKDFFPSFSIEFVPPEDISKPMPRRAYQNDLLLI